MDLCWVDTRSTSVLWPMAADVGMAQVQSFTFNALVGDLEVGFKVFVARLGFGKWFVKYAHPAGTSAGALGINFVHDVTTAAYVTEVFLHAAVDAHASVLRTRDKHHFVVPTSCVEELRLAELRGFWKRKNTILWMTLRDYFPLSKTGTLTFSIYISVQDNSAFKIQKMSQRNN